MTGWWMAFWLMGAPAELPAFTSSISELSAEIRQEMTGVSWREGCPVPLDDLRLLQLTFFGFDGAAHTGELVVHVTLAPRVVDVFEDLYTARFPIERLQRVDAYGGDDDKSMAANNTSAFNCRAVSGRPGVYSRHAFGVAIDVNPKTNPFVRKGRVDPPGGKAFLDRTQTAPGLIVKGDRAWTAFTSRGFSWGGTWRSMKDYQHFQHARPKPSADKPPPSATQPGAGG